MDREMQKALEADGEKLRQLTGEDHGPHFAAVNTDRELWREQEGDYYADSIFVTADGCIGMNCGGMVFVMPIRSWHELAKARFPAISPKPD